MKVLVTGGAGFIGSHIADAYLAAGHEIVVVDNLSTGRHEYVNPGARFYEVDIRGPELREVFERERPEVVNHQAAQASVILSIDDPRLDAEINVLGTVHLFALCAEFGVRRIIFASTGGAIYGDPEHLPVEETSPARPLAPYGISKLTGEMYLRFFSARGLQWAILRYANVYGPRQDPYGEAGVVAIFTRAMLEGRSPVIHGNGTQTRDFVYVEDVARANLLATDALTSGLANIGTGMETSVNEIYRQLAAFTGFRGRPTYAAARPGEVYRIALSAEPAKQWLGWMPRTTLSEGLRRTVDWLRLPGLPRPLEWEGR